MIGEVDNGTPVTVQVGTWTGPGALDKVNDVERVTYIGPAPLRFPSTVTVDQVERLALSKAKHRQAGPFTILTLAEVPPTPAEA